MQSILCPFCKSQSTIQMMEAENEDGTPSYWLYCDSCGMGGPEKNTIEEAEESWKTRATIQGKKKQRVMLLPCPFCGSESDLKIAKDDDEIIYWISCGLCKTTGPEGDSKKAANEAWDNRFF